LKNIYADEELKKKQLPRISQQFKKRDSVVAKNAHTQMVIDIDYLSG